MNKQKQPIKLQTLVDASLDSLTGSTPDEIKKTYGLSKRVIDKSMAKIDDVMMSTSPALTFERKLISEAITDRLKPIKEDLAVKSLEIVHEADRLVLERLQDPKNKSKIKDLVSVSDTYSKRLARMTGIEEDPTAGSSDPNERSKNINIFVQNTFKDHTEKLNSERNTINTLDATPVYDDKIEPEPQKD